MSLLARADFMPWKEPERKFYTLLAQEKTIKEFEERTPIFHQNDHFPVCDRRIF